METLPEAQAENLVLILDYGSQYTHLITRRVRSLSVLSLCLNGTAPLSDIASHRPRLVILSGGSHSVHAAGAPSFPDGFLDYVRANRVAVLGICYGMQLLVHHLGGEVRRGDKQEYGKMEIDAAAGSGLFGAASGRQVLWMSHGDEVVRLLQGFEVVWMSHGPHSCAGLEKILARGWKKFLPRSDFGPSDYKDGLDLIPFKKKFEI